MPTYRRLTVAHLRELCDDRGIDGVNYTYKRELIHALEQHDLENENMIEDEMDVRSIEMNGHEIDVEGEGLSENENGYENDDMTENYRLAMVMISMPAKCFVRVMQSQKQL